MKYTFKRPCLCLLLVACFVFSALFVTGCYSVKSGKMKQIIGTYELTTYSTDKDELTENAIICTIELREDGTGTYTYQDNDTPRKEGVIVCRYEQDSEDASKYSYVHIKFGDDTEEHTFGINVKKENINFNKPVYKGSILNGTLEVDYYKKVEFTRVEEDTSFFSFFKNLFS